MPTGEHVFTWAFKAPNGTNRVIVLSDDCVGVNTAACGASPGVSSVSCQATSGLATFTDPDLGDRRIVFPFPGL